MRKQISAVAAGLVLVGLLLIPTYPQQSTPAPVSIQVDGRTRFQTIDGFGAALTPFEWDGIFKAHDPAQPEKVTASLEDRQAIARLLFTELGLTHARLFLNGFEPANDNENPFTFNNAGFDWTWVNWRTDFVSLARPYGLQTWWATFTMDGGEREAWLRRPGSVCALDPRMIDEEVEWLLAAALHFRELGVELPYLAVNNEPYTVPVNLVLLNVSPNPAALSVLTSREGVIWESQPEIAITDAKASMSLPPLSVTTFLSH